VIVGRIRMEPFTIAGAVSDHICAVLLGVIPAPSLYGGGCRCYDNAALRYLAATLDQSYSAAFFRPRSE
jgi:hypothetical protein